MTCLPRKCSVEGCDRQVVGLGLCNRHWCRNKRHGSPTGGGTGMGEAQAFFQSALTHDSDECLLWPYAIGPTDGYPRVRFGDETVVAHRLVLEKTAGPPPDPELQAAHNCGVKRCVNPRHLRWATRLDNIADTIRHGTRIRGEMSSAAKLTEDDIRAIRSDTRSQSAIGRAYGIAQSHVRNIKLRRAWSHVQ